MNPFKQLRGAWAALSLTTLGLVAAPTVQAAAFIDVGSDVIAQIELDYDNTLPTDNFTVTYGNGITNDEAAATGALSYAASSPLLFPDSADEAMLAGDMLENQHNNVGEAGSLGYSISGNVYTATASDGYIEIQNDTDSSVDVVFNLYLSMNTLVETADINAFDTASAFANAIVQIYDDYGDYNLAWEIQSTLAGNAAPVDVEQQIMLTVAPHDFRSLGMYVNTSAGGTAVPAPASLALMLAGIIGMRISRRQSA